MRSGLGLDGEHDSHAQDLMISLVGYVERLALATAIAGAMYEGRAESPTPDDLVRGLMTITMDGSTLAKCEEVWAAYSEGRAIDFVAHGISVHEATEMMMYMGMSRDEMQRAVIRSFFTTDDAHAEAAPAADASAANQGDSSRTGSDASTSTSTSDSVAATSADVAAAGSGSGGDSDANSQSSRDQGDQRAAGRSSADGGSSTDSTGSDHLPDADYLAWKSAHERWSQFVPSTGLQVIMKQAVTRALEHQQQQQQQQASSSS